MKQLRVKTELLVEFVDDQGMTEKDVIDLLNNQLRNISEEWDNCDVETNEIPWGTMEVVDVIKTDYYVFNVVYSDSPFCEHCGENHQPFAASISGEGTWFCVNCHDDLTDDEKENILKTEKKKEIAYHKKRIKELEK